MMMLSELLSTSAVKNVQRGIMRQNFHDNLQNTYITINISPVNINKSVLITQGAANRSEKPYRNIITLYNNYIMVRGSSESYRNVNDKIVYRVEVDSFAWQVIEFS